MIQVVIYEDLQGDLSGFIAGGHAGYSKDGEPDIICSAITALSAGVIATFTDILKVKIDYTLEDGNISCFIKEEVINKTDKINLILESYELSCKQISISYGESYVKVMRNSRN